jgi:Ala-tRNA(Pro) deacylase
MAEDVLDCNRELETERKAPKPQKSGCPTLPRAGSQPRGLFHFNAAITKMPKTQAELFDFLNALGIETTTVAHPALFTVAQSQELRGEITGAHTKNLFLKDKKDNYFLLTVDEESQVDLKTADKKIGAASRVSFGKPEAMMELLGVTPGAVTSFGLINDTNGRVRFVLDERLAAAEIINAHPLTNEATTSIKSRDLIRFAEATGHPPLILNLGA